MEMMRRYFPSQLTLLKLKIMTLPLRKLLQKKFSYGTTTEEIKIIKYITINCLSFL